MWSESAPVAITLRSSEVRLLCRYATDPFDTPKRVPIRKVVNRIDGFSHSKITDRRVPFANSVLPFAFNLRLPHVFAKLSLGHVVVTSDASINTEAIS
jgi:hypothetical protein